MAEAEAMADPAMAPINMAEMILIKARPPGIAPTKDLAKAINLWAIPPWFINSPDKIKKGMASKAKLSNPVAILWEMVANAGKVGTLTNKVNMEDMAMLHATGVPIAKRPTKLIINTSKGIYSIGSIRI